MSMTIRLVRNHRTGAVTVEVDGATADDNCLAATADLERALGLIGERTAKEVSGSRRAEPWVPEGGAA